MKTEQGADRASKGAGDKGAGVESVCLEVPSRRPAGASMIPAVGGFAQLLTPVSLRPLWMVLLALDAHSLSASSRPQHGTLSTDHPPPPPASKPALNPLHHDSLSFLNMYYFLSGPGEVIRRNTKKGRMGTFEIPGIFSVHGEVGRKLEEEFLLLGAGFGGLQILSGEAKGVPEIESYR